MTDLHQFFSELSDKAVSVMENALRQAPSAMSAFFVEHFHGAVTRVSPTATAFPHREPGYNLVMIGEWAEAADDAASMDWVRSTWDALEPHMADRSYVNYLGDDESARVRSAYGANYDRLVELKRRYDPQNVFRLNQNIDPRCAGSYGPAMTDQAETFYLASGPMTDLSECDAVLLDGLPNDVEGLMAVVRGCVTSPPDATPQGRDHEVNIRPASALVARIAELHEAPLVVGRTLEDKLLGTCRHFATLTCALLRHVGTPARVRAGFAGYFVKDTWMDHWVIEYVRDGRWVRTDPELDETWFRNAGLDTSAEALATNLFLPGPEAWRRCRAGELDPGRFVMGGHIGIGEVRGSVLYDLAALNKHEMLPWDCWGQMEQAYASQTGPDYDDMLDAVAGVVGTDDLDAIRNLYNTSEDLRVPSLLLR